MSTTVDQRVVEMRFDNKQFESNVKDTMSTLSKLKESLKFKDSIKGFEQLDSASKKCDLGVLKNAVGEVQARFSALEVIGVTTLANITNSAVNAGKRMISALTIDPIKTGFQEYETQINSVQTILANTQSKGTTLDQVNAALDELNLYADKTIYNFTEMTRNIGTFTAAGIDLKTSVSAIQGIANLAAVSGSTSQQASTAMYQLSQALAAGTVKLQDWNSVVNAGMGGQVFQDALKKTAEEIGTDVDAIIEKEGSFRESLKDGWITTEVLTKTLNKMTTSGAKEWVAEYTDLSYEMVASILDEAEAQYGEADAIKKASEALAEKSGANADEIESVLQMAKTAEEAATKVKTFSQLWDTLKEAAQSGWTQSWEYIVGDFEEAKDLLTSISDTIGGMIGDSANARNDVLLHGISSGWKQLLQEGIADSEGYRDAIMQVARDNGVAIDDLIVQYGSFEKSLKSGWATSDILSQGLDNLIEKFENMSDEELKNAGYTKDQIHELNNLKKAVDEGTISLDDFSKKMKEDSGREHLINGLKNIFNLVVSIGKIIKETFNEIFPPITSEQLYNLTSDFENLTSKLRLSDDTVSKLQNTFKGLFSIFDIGWTLIKDVFQIVSNFVPILSSTGNSILNITSNLGLLLIELDEIVKSSSTLTAIVEGSKTFVNSIDDVLNSIASSVFNISSVFQTVGNVISDVLSKIWSAVKEVVSYITSTLSIDDMFTIAIGSGLLSFIASVTGSVKGLTEIFETAKKLVSGGFLGLIFGSGEGDSVERAKSIKDAAVEVLDSLRTSLQAFTTGFRITALVAIAAAIGVLTASLKTLSQLDPVSIAVSLGAMGAMFMMLSGTFKSMTKILDTIKPSGIVKSAVALLVISEAVKVLSNAIVNLSSLSFGELAVGLTGMGAALVALIGALNFVNKTGSSSLKSAVVILALAESCKIIADAFMKFASMSTEQIQNGIIAMGSALLELSVVMGVLNKVGGKSSLAGSTSLLIMVQSLRFIAEALKVFGSMSMDSIKRGLIAMGGALAELGTITAVMGKFANSKSFVGSTSILLISAALIPLADSLKKFGEMQWDEIGRGLTAMGIALAELAVISGVLGKFGSFSSIIGAGAIDILIAGLDPLANAMIKFGSMSWDGINQALQAMGLSFLEMGTVVTAAGKIAGLSGIIGAASIDLVIAGLDPLANAMIKFGSMSWDEIGRGLVAMGGALAEIAAISGVLGSIAGLAGILGSASILIVTQGLGDLADAFKKFGEMQWDEIGRGFVAMAAAMGDTAIGGLLNTFSGFGANAIATIAEPLGVLADSVKKWENVTVPEGLDSQLAALAEGIQSFTLSGWGSDAVSTVAEPLGVMAESVKKWIGITIPENMSSDLASLAEAIKEFTFSGFAAGDIATVAEPLGTLAESVDAWKEVTIPENIGTDLGELAKGVKEFTWSGFASNDISTVAAPIGTLAESIKKWAYVKVPSTLKDDLKSISEAIKSFSGSGTNFTNTASDFQNLSSAISSVTSSDFTGVIGGIQDFISSSNEVSSLVEVFNTTGSDMVSGIIEPIQNGVPDITAATQDLITAVSNTISDSMGEFENLGTMICEGLANGISSNSYIVAARAREMARSAANAAREELDVHSPSRVFRAIGNWIPKGLAIGIDEMISVVTNSSKNMASSTLDPIKSAVSDISSLVDDDSKLSPVITPVVDMTNVSNGLYSINKMFTDSSIGILSTANASSILGSSSNTRQTDSSVEIVNAIRGLGRKIEDISGDTYNVGGITYDDGSNVASAVASLIRAAKIERRV